MIKFICDLCKKELESKDFFSELLVRRVRQVFNKADLKKQMEEKHFNICQECLGKVFPDFNK